MKVLVIGDVVGKIGVDAVKKNLPDLKKKYDIDFTIVNGENSADGMGITKNIMNDLYKSGADVITMGNHTWGKKEIFSFIDEEEKLIRPSNYAEGLPGKGKVLLDCKNKKIGVIDLIGRVNVGGNFDSPFERADKDIVELKAKGADIIIVEIHAEATAEKIALGYYLKDKATIVYGTHTHVQTADEKIYETGMGYITDIGMTGPKDSIIGMEPAAALKRFLTQMPERYACAQGEAMLNGVVFEIDEQSKNVSKITRICL
ncbi:MAG: TIGR00282 family metallophosphoesterase [Clostridia bacterium]|nr:TIGR00282 family metallophosphoesterase [Clostridia bacterium]